MALTRRADGTSTANQVFAAWWNDYLDLLTGVMTDQPVTVANNVKTKGSSAGFTWNGTLAGVGKNALTLQPTDAGGKTWTLALNPDYSVSLYDSTDNVTPLRAYPSGAVTLGGNLTITGTLAATATAASVLTNPATTFNNDVLTLKRSDPGHGQQFNIGINQDNSGNGGLYFYDGNLAKFTLQLEGGMASLGVLDGGVASQRLVRIFLGLADPATYTTVKEGDIWLQA